MSELADEVIGSEIRDLQETEDGAHVVLDDGRVLIFYGAKIVAIADLEEHTIQ